MGRIQAVAISDDAKIIASASYSVLQFWDMDGNEIKRLYTHENYIRALAFSPDGQQIACWEKRSASGIGKMHCQKRFSEQMTPGFMTEPHSRQKKKNFLYTSSFFNITKIKRKYSLNLFLYSNIEKSS